MRLPRLMMMGGGAWTPAKLSPALWLKSSVGLYQDAAKTTPATADADPVGAWADQSGNGNDATQGTDTNRPSLQNAAGDLVNGVQTVRGDGADNYMSHAVVASDPTVLTIFILATKKGILGTRVAWAHRSEITRLIQILYVDATEIRLQLRGSVTAIQTIALADLTLTSPHIITARFNKAGNSHNLWVNGSPGTANTTAFGSETFTSTKETLYGYHDGSAYAGWCDVDILDLIIYTTALSDANRAKVEQYLATLAGITL